MKRIYTTAEAAARLEVSVQTIQLWSDEGHLPAWRTKGGHRRVDADAVDAMAARHAQDAGSGSARMSIIAIEQEAEAEQSLRSQLREVCADADVRFFGDVFAALLDAGRAVPDLLILDSAMPGADPLALVQALGRLPATQGVRVVLTSRHGSGGRPDLIELPHGVAWLPRPFSATHLGSALERAAPTAQHRQAG
ncbi:MAG: excisionase family DNA-binding protein [Burkholderiales bacterium]|nr:excisionase family DNA-binding protein [Burkholderiales bacterium]